MSRPLTALVLGLLLLGSKPANGQSDYLELYARYARTGLYTGAVVLPADSAAVAIFTVRVPNSRLVFLREHEQASDAAFVARVEVTVQVRSEDDRLIAERVWRAAHTAPTYDVSVSRTDDFEGQVRIRIEPGAYAYRILIRDVTGDVVFAERPRTLEVPRFRDGFVGAPVAVRAWSTTSVSLANLGGDLPFAGDSRLLVPVSVNEGEFRYVLWRLPELTRRDQRRPARASADLDEWELQEPVQADLTDAEPVAEGRVPREDWISFAPPDATSDGMAGNVVPIEPAAGTSTYLVPVPVATVTDREARFALETVLEMPSGARRHVTPFAFHWRDMPIALRDAETAIRMLSYIEEPERIREMLRGSRQSQARAIVEYWEERDPSPGTPFNELMAEYYRRIDHAALEFRTGGGPIPNGLRTDQAQVYIVHGPPTDVERTFPPSGGVEETWTYEDGRRFVFWATSSLEPLALQNEDRSR